MKNKQQEEEYTITDCIDTFNICVYQSIINAKIIFRK